MEEIVGFPWPWAGNAWLSAVSLLVFGAILSLRLLPEGRAFASRYRWSMAISNLVLAPLVAGALGHLFHQMAVAFEARGLANNISFGTSFIVALVFAGAFGRLFEVWLLSR
ncbi:MAG: hypothetical protein AAFX81_12095 [Pseudomonadota bacterium]